MQGAAIDPATGTLWTIEFGPQGGDELNRPEAGKNYGWPLVSRGRSRIATGERIRDVEQGPDGSIYVATDYGNGVIWRLRPQ